MKYCISTIGLRLAATRPELLRGVIVHEPPLWGVISDDPDLAPLVEEDQKVAATAADRIASGDHDAGARLFIEEQLGTGSWSRLPHELRATVIENAPTFADEARDPDQYAFEPAWLADFHRPVMLTMGTESLPMYAGVVSRLAHTLPAAEVVRFEGAGHLPHMTHPHEHIEATRDFIRRMAAQP